MARRGRKRTNRNPEKPYRKWTIRIDEDLAAEFERYADERGVTINRWLVALVEWYVEQEARDRARREQAEESA